MSIRMYMPNNHAQRTADGKIVLQVSKSQEMPPLPYELSGLLSHETWDQRTQTIKSMCDRYSKPLIERVWFVAAMISTLALPFPLYRVVFNAVFDQNRPEETFFKARAAGFGIFLGVILISWGPLVAWKWIGSSRMRRVTRDWEAHDRANANGRFVPDWKVEVPGIFSLTGRITITTPPHIAPTSFSHGAYLPPYINAPAYMQGPYPQQGPVPGYSNGGPGYSYREADEKAGFHDVNLKV